MTEIEWQDVLANLDRLTNESLKEIMDMCHDILVERRQKGKDGGMLD